MIAAFLDHLLCILPFELPYFEKVGLPASFVGHPVVEQDGVTPDGAGFRRRHGLSDLLSHLVWVIGRQTAREPLADVRGRAPTESCAALEQRNAPIIGMVPATNCHDPVWGVGGVRGPLQG